MTSDLDQQLEAVAAAHAVPVPVSEISDALYSGDPVTKLRALGEQMKTLTAVSISPLIETSREAIESIEALADALEQVDASCRPPRKLTSSRRQRTIKRDMFRLWWPEYSFSEEFIPQGTRVVAAAIYDNTGGDLAVVGHGQTAGLAYRDVDQKLRERAWGWR